MRWRFPIGLSPSESTARDAKRADIDAWWADLVAAWPTVAASFRNDASFDVADFMARAFNARVHPAVMWEFGPHAGGGDFLALCPEARKDLVPLVDEVLARAPRIEGLHVRRGRPPIPLDHAHATVRARVGGAVPPGVRVDTLADVGLLALTWQVGPGEAADQRALERAFVATEALLGEEVLDTWIGPIDVEAAPSVGWFDRLRGRAPPAAAAPVATLPERVEAGLAALRAALPAAPWGPAGPDEQGTLYKVTPADPPTLARRGDMFLCRTRAPRIAEAFLRGGSFVSERHSRHGEVFAYVKIPRTPDDDGREVEARARYEDALDAALGGAGLGGVIGAGMGTTFLYVDLALTRPDAALPVVRAALRALNAPNATWVLFFDATLAEEWVGAWDDTPPPPADPAN